MDRILEPVVAAVVPETCDLYGHIITGGKPYIGGEDQSRSIAVVAGLHVHIGPGPVGIFAGDRILLSGLFTGHGDLDPGLVAGAQRILEESKLMLQGPVKYSTGMFRAGHSTISGTSSYPLSVPSKLYMAV